MAKNVTYVVMYVSSGGREQSHVLGELGAVYSPPFTLGRDPSCDVVVDHPSVEPRAAEFSGASNHRFVKTPEDEQRRRIDGRPVQIGELEIALAELIDPRAHARPDAGLPIRFGPRGLGIALDQLPVDVRQTDAHRIASSLRDPGTHVRRLDDESRAWCAEQIQIHFSALSWVTTPVSPGRIEYTSSLEAALARVKLLWSAAERQAFRHTTWGHVHRADRWRRELRDKRYSDLDHAETFARPIAKLVAHEALRPIADAALSTHLATLEDDVSPARPIANLIARGVYPLALPDGAMLLYLDSADGAIAQSSDPVEAELVTAIACDPQDDRSRLVLGDHFEQRGELVRAAAIRARGGAALGTRVDYGYEQARWLLATDTREGTQAPLELEATPPPAHLEIGGRRHELAIATDLEFGERDWIIGPAAPGSAPDAIISYAGGVLWISCGRRYTSATVNERMLFAGTRYPLFDADVISIGRGNDVLVRCPALERAV